MSKQEQMDILQTELYHEKLTNQILCAENEVLRNRIAELYTQNDNNHNSNMIIENDKIRKSIPYRALRKIYRILFKRSN